MNFLIFLKWASIAIFAMFGSYITVRLCSNAVFRSWKEFLLWKKKYIGTSGEN